MKPSIVIPLGFLVLSLIAQACGEEALAPEQTSAPTPEVTSSPELTPTPTATPTLTPTPAPATVGDRLEDEQLAITLNAANLNWPEPNEFRAPDPDSRFVLVDVTIENKATTPTLYFNPLHFVIADSSSARWDYEASSAEPALSYGELTPGEKVRGVMTFEVPESATGLRLLYAPDGRALAEWELE